MTDFETFSDQTSFLKQWASQRSRGFQRLELPRSRIDAGERHGSWFLRVLWHAGDLTRTAELALTNPESLPENASARVHISVRSSSSHHRGEIYSRNPIRPDARRELA